MKIKIIPEIKIKKIHEKMAYLFQLRRIYILCNFFKKKRNLIDPF